MKQLPALVFALVVLAGGMPAAAALRGLNPLDENPRASWFERYQESRQGPEQTERFTRTYKVDPQGALDLSHVSGDVRITTGAGSELRLEAIKRVRHRNPEEGKRLLAALRVEVSQVSGRIEVRTIYPRLTANRGFSGSVDYTIVVPQTLSVSLKTVSGDLSVQGVRGEVRVETISGDVEVVSTPNLAVAKSVSGDVNARDIAASTLTLGTVSGSVIATALKVRSLEAGSVSGDVQLSNLQVERLSAKSFSGNIAFDGALQRGTRYEFTSHSGDVRLVLLAETSGFELDASTFSGSVRSDFPVEVRSIGRTRRQPAPTRAVRGAFGDAGAILAVRSFSGSVVITRK